MHVVVLVVACWFVSQVYMRPLRYLFLYTLWFSSHMILAFISISTQLNSGFLTVVFIFCYHWRSAIHRYVHILILPRTLDHQLTNAGSIGGIADMNVFGMAIWDFEKRENKTLLKIEFRIYHGGYMHSYIKGNTEKKNYFERSCVLDFCGHSEGISSYVALNNLHKIYKFSVDLCSLHNLTTYNTYTYIFSQFKGLLLGRTPLKLPIISSDLVVALKTYITSSYLTIIQHQISINFIS